MALKKSYYSVQGEIIGEKATGGSRVDYLGRIAQWHQDR